MSIGLCIIYLLQYIQNTPQITTLSQQTFVYPTAAGSGHQVQLSWLPLAHSFSHTKPESVCWWGSHHQAQQERSCFQTHPSGYWQVSDLCWLWISHQLLNHMDFSIGLLTIHSLLLPKWAISERKRKGDSIWKLQSFYNLISEVMFNCFCFILFIRSELLNLALTQREGSTQGSE